MAEVLPGTRPRDSSFKYAIPPLSLARAAAVRTTPTKSGKGAAHPGRPPPGPTAAPVADGAAGLISARSKVAARRDQGLTLGPALAGFVFPAAMGLLFAAL